MTSIVRVTKEISLGRATKGSGSSLGVTFHVGNIEAIIAEGLIVHYSLRTLKPLASLYQVTL